jgi:hypothetical protein
MTEPESDRASITAWKSWLLTVVICLAVPAVGWIIEQFAGGLRHTNAAFFSTAGAVGPIIGLALFVEIVVVMAPEVAKPGGQAVKAGAVRMMVRTNAALLVLSEGAALYAAGANTSSAFLVVCVVLPWFLQLALLVDTAYHRMGLERIRR